MFEIDFKRWGLCKTNWRLTKSMGSSKNFYCESETYINEIGI